MSKQEKTKKIKEHLAHFNIAGFTYYDGAEAFAELKMGQELDLSLDPENKFDNRAVLISYKDWKLGYIPRSDNRIFYKLLKTGVNNIVLRIQRLDAQDHPESQVQVVAHLEGSSPS